MDFIRASIKALFSDYPVDSAIQIVTTNNATLIGDFVRLVNAREKSYGQAGLESLRQKLCHEWLGQDCIADGTDEILYSLRLPAIYAESALDQRQLMSPVVQFKQLFRWNEIIRYVGENLMSVSMIAKKDVENGVRRSNFTWSNVLPHNDGPLNAELHRGTRALCDIHSHFGGSTDVFAFSWISLMNNIRGKKDAFAWLKHPLDSPVIVTKRYNYDDLYRWCVLAAMIRWELFRYYAEGDSDTFGQEFEEEFFQISHQVPLYFRYELRNLQCMLTDAGKRSEQTSDGRVFDYALNTVSLGSATKDSPYLILQGERFLLYQFYRDYWNKEDRIRKICKYVYVYELIKNQLRKELTQVNELYGLMNFQAYNRRKTLFVDKGLGFTSRKFSIQSTLEHPMDGMEVRITPQKSGKDYKRLFNMHYHEALFGKTYYMTETSLRSRLTFVVNFLKTACNENNRFSTLRSNLHRQAEILMEDLYKDEIKNGECHRIVGIDVAGGETYSRPEVFAHLYRYCRKCGMTNFTYHVGEDFYDLTDGLRSIDEAVKLLQIGERNRLGHCLALGMDAQRYYQQRHRTVMMPKQTLLDNIVWLFKQAEHYRLGIEKTIRDELTSIMTRLYGEIGYAYEFDLDSYYRSMQLRGDDMVKYLRQYSDWLATALDDSAEAMEARKDGVAIMLREDYFNNKDIYRQGFKASVEFKAPYQYEKLIKKLQNKMIRWINVKGICIEANPTSNVRIGQLDGYQNHPLYRFSRVRKRPDQNVIVSVNTDDKGLFSTSMQREFSLIALALMKQKKKGRYGKWTDEEVRRYVGNLADNGQRNRFR